MFSIVEGDMFDSKETYLCHQCNCVTNRAAHLAAAVFDKYPHADIYSGRLLHDIPGAIVTRGNGKDERFVINMLGQYYPGSPKYPNSPQDGRAARLTYFWRCLLEMKELDGDFAFPWTIGCGAAGGDWARYLSGLVWFEQQIKGDVVVYRLKNDS